MVFPLNVVVDPLFVTLKFPLWVQLLPIVMVTAPPGALVIDNGTAQMHPADEYVTAATPDKFEFMPNAPVKAMLVVPSVMFPPTTLNVVSKVMVPV
jgi:hypothetical protein